MIRRAYPQDLPSILRVYEIARKFMADNGNSSQWGADYPSEEMLKDDIEKQQLYVYVKQDLIHGVFAFIPGKDSSYENIENGSWRSDSPYSTIHRIASDGIERGIFTKCINYCKEQSPHLRIDTHENNEVMKHLIQKNGFVKCGTVYLKDETQRIAFDYLKEV
ncbi:GNAT family N-acetyltransferase [Tissierella carlieri]|uniref:GNAT family N-acetyltransferase n=1 Tax=Tissierella carlieri TaxID=689904 RepID=UPI001C1149CF|nr:GNAT family N-acetyltransferase [Tissierella carlieri]MBU5310982.1 GNAT family N-acetyltransferase [Tissierella carlieri]